ncbi:MAG: glutamate-semialdehyde -aminomutase [Bacteroidales bacterium]|jgi:glutamate-1-semialdehyde 2,1-aminomutase|nr:glutamate-semialdehyde -aminomutase [Bacteroidales bacterium]MDN5330754.1 glutamate-semialdehyde -aminomutase [Bacteroidales bacterium]
MKIENKIDKEMALFERALKVMPGGVSRNTIFRKPHPHYVASASGCYVEDIYGVKRIDFVNNMASLIHGHAHPDIVEAVSEQLRRGTAFSLGTEIEIEHAELITSRVPGFEKIRFMNSGTEAVMSLIKLARAYTGKPKIAKAEGAYHGTYDFAEVSQVASPDNWGPIDNPARVPLAFHTPKGVLNDVVIFPFNDIERTISILDKYAGEIACVLIDPVPHRINMVRATEEYIQAIYDWTRKNNALLAFDEVISFRVDFEGAQALYKVKPDLTSLGKIIGGGFPIGAIAGKAEIMDFMNPARKPLPFSLSFTFAANPVSMLAGKIAMQLFDREAVNRLNNLAKIARNQLSEAAQMANIPFCTAGEGSMFRMYFSPTPPASYREAYADDKLKQIQNIFLDLMYDEGIMLINSLSCMLSTAMTQKEIDLLTEAALKGFRYIKPMLIV